MRLIFAGCGSAFTTQEYYQSNMVVESSVTGKRLLIDCGSDARFSLGEMGLGATDVDAVYISHLHADHIGGLEWLAFVSHFAGKAFLGARPTLYAVRDLVGPLWRSLEGGLRSIEGNVMELGDYFDVHAVSINTSFLWGGHVFTPVQTCHIVDGYRIVPSYGLIVQPGLADKGRKVLISTDTQFAPRQLTHFYKECDTIFHDCETSAFPSGVHAHYDELKTLPEEIRAKMWLYHYQANTNAYDPVADGFRGFVSKGQSFEF